MYFISLKNNKKQQKIENSKAYPTIVIWKNNVYIKCSAHSTSVESSSSGTRKVNIFKSQIIEMYLRKFILINF